MRDTILVSMLFVSLAGCTQLSTLEQPRQWVCITCESDDKARDQKVYELFEKHGITSSSEGSVVIGIAVPKKDALKAVILLYHKKLIGIKEAQLALGELYGTRIEPWSPADD